MRILLSTTLAHNPGDELIAMGIMNLLQYGVKISDLEVVLYNRNPDLQEGPSRIPRRNLVGNYQTDPVDLSYIDAVVLAGSPEWFGGPMLPLYEALKNNPHVPLYALGVGLGDPKALLSSLDEEVLGRLNTVIITRSVETTEWLANQAIGSHCLPCPALFSSMTSYVTEKKPNLLILQKPGNQWHEIPEHALNGLAGTTDDILCLHIKELKYFSGRGVKTKYAGSGSQVLKKVAKYDRVISTRLHGAIGALSMGVPAIVVSGGDYRIETCARMMGGLLPAFNTLYEADQHGTPWSRDNILEFKWRKWNEWIIHLKETGLG